MTTGDTGTGRALPEGTLTFLLTDIEGSAARWDGDAGAMGEAQRMHDDVIAAAVAAEGGTLVKSKGEGDSTFSVFVDPKAAVLAAERIRDAISQTQWPTAQPLRVRVGTSTGVAELRDSDYFGAPVVRAARVRGLAQGDEVLLGALTYALVADSLLRCRSPMPRRDSNRTSPRTVRTRRVCSRPATPARRDRATECVRAACGDREPARLTT